MIPTNPALPAAAYGLRIDGLHAPDATVETAPPEWPLVTVRQYQEEHRPTGYQLTGPSVEMPLLTGGYVGVDSETMTARFHVPTPLTHDEMLHPYFAAAAAWFSHWLGRHCFHAGAVVLGGKAYAVLGEKEAGKSTLVAWMSGAGLPVLADDLVVVAEGRVLTGPRCLDLRAPTFDALREAVPGTLVRGGSRFRFTLAQTEPDFPLGGWIFPRWGERLSLDAVPVRERLARLSAHRVFRLPPTKPADLVEFAALPAWEFTRPRGWDLMDAAVDLVSATLSR